MSRLYLFSIIAAAAACGETPQATNDASIDAAVAQPDGQTAPLDAAPPRSCEGLAAQPVNSTVTILSDGRDRFANVHVPESYDPTQPTPVVLNFHGFSSTANQQALLSRLNAKADAEGFIAVHATGVGLVNSWNGGACCGTAADQDVDDILFVSDLLDDLERRLCVDVARVYSTGLSNGGFLSHRLACELSDRIAAIAPVAGVVGIQDCAPPRPVPVMQFHGTSDLVVPYDGSTTLGFGSAPEVFSTWTDINGCSGSETDFDEGDATCVSALNCAESATVTLCTIDGGGHNWPGGIPIPGSGKTSTDISATDAMWQFFSDHPHPNLQ